MNKKYILGKTMIGSHIWKMNTPKSDEDYFKVYMDTTEDVFRGTAKYKSYFTQDNGVDVHSHEIKKVIEQILKGNINFIIGITSSIIIETTKHFDELRHLTFRNLSKNTYHSIHGMSKHNYQKYIIEKEDTSERKCNQILRALEFGITLLKYRKIEYKPFTDGTPELILKKMDELDKAYEKSTIPEKPNEDELRDYLCKMRKWNWWDNLEV